MECNIFWGTFLEIYSDPESLIPGVSLYFWLVVILIAIYFIDIPLFWQSTKILIFSGYFVKQLVTKFLILPC